MDQWVTGLELPTHTKSIECSCSSEVHVQSFQSQVCTDKEDCKGTEVHVDTCTN